MLRISVVDAPQTTRLKLEGKLAHEWVAEMETVWTVLMGTSSRKRVIVDLADVSFVDGAGKELLSRIYESGCELVGSGPMMAALIEEIQTHQSLQSRRGIDGKFLERGEVSRIRHGSNEPNQPS